MNLAAICKAQADEIIELKNELKVATLARKDSFQRGGNAVLQHWKRSLSLEVAVELSLSGMTVDQLETLRKCTSLYLDISKEHPRWSRRRIPELSGAFVICMTKLELMN